MKTRYGFFLQPNAKTPVTHPPSKADHAQLNERSQSIAVDLAPRTFFFSFLRDPSDDDCHKTQKSTENLKKH